MSKKFFTFTVFLLLSAIACAQSLRLDDSYGYNGILNFRIRGNQISSHYCSNVTKNFGVILGFGGSSMISKYNFRLCKITPNGSNGSSFGLDGLTYFTKSMDTANLIPTSIAEGPDSSIYTLIQIYSNRAGVVKMKSNGMVDSTFGLNGYIEFNIKGKSITPKEISISNDLIHVRGDFRENDRNVCFVKCFKLNGEVYFLKSGQTHLEYDNTSLYGTIFNSHVVDFPYIYLAGSTMDSGSSAFLLVKMHLTDHRVATIKNEFKIDKWQFHNILKLKLVNNSFYLMGIFMRNINKENTSLIAKLDKNLVLDKSFNKNGIKVSTVYPDKIFYYDFSVSNNKIYIVGGRSSSGSSSSFIKKQFINCISTDGNDMNTFADNSFFYFDGLQSAAKITITPDSKILLTYDEQDFTSIQYVMNVSTDVINNKFSNEISIYPNPTQSVLNFNDNVEFAKLYSLQGNILFSANNTDNLDLTPLNSGVYFVEIQVGLVKKYFKVIKH
jgi:hypothetical protein